jgi:hypothetical protein
VTGAQKLGPCTVQHFCIFRGKTKLAEAQTNIEDTKQKKLRQWYINASYNRRHTVNPMGPILALCLIRHKMCSFFSYLSKREYVVPILAFHVCPNAGTGAGGLHVELCVPNENHRAYSAALFHFKV